MLAFVVIAGALVALVGGLGEAIVARHRAVVAADLAAVAAARTAAGTSAAGGTDTPCRTAEQLVADNDAQLVSCVVDNGGVVTVYVRADTYLGPNVVHATENARAGPAEMSMS
jgi:secretion/DNA translocation related TadE-like protein